MHDLDKIIVKALIAELRTDWDEIRSISTHMGLISLIAKEQCVKMPKFCKKKKKCNKRLF